MTLAVLLLCFNRPALTKLALQSIIALSPRALYVAIDGARSDRPEDAHAVQQVLETIVHQTENLFFPVYIRTQKRNLGGGAAIFDATSWFFRNENEGLIFEDDCAVHPTGQLLADIIISLGTVRKSCFSLSLSDYLDVDRDTYGSTYRFSRYHTSGVFWSQRKAWEGLSIDLREFSLLSSFWRIGKSLRCRLPSTLYWCAQLVRLKYGDVTNFWDVQFTLKCLISGSINVVLNGGIVRNHGMESSSSGRSYSDLAWIADLPVRPLEAKLIAPREFKVDQRFDTAFEKTVLGLSWKGLFLKLKRRLAAR